MHDLYRGHALSAWTILNTAGMTTYGLVQVKCGYILRRLIPVLHGAGPPLRDTISHRLAFTHDAGNDAVMYGATDLQS